MSVLFACYFCLVFVVQSDASFKLTIIQASMQCAIWKMANYCIFLSIIYCTCYKHYNLATLEYFLYILIWIFIIYMLIWDMREQQRGNKIYLYMKNTQKTCKKRCYRLHIRKITRKRDMYNINVKSSLINFYLSLNNFIHTYTY